MNRSPLSRWLVLGLLVSGCRPGIAQSVPRVVDEFADRTGFNGVVLVARADSTLHAGAYGYEDAEARVPTRLDTRYQVGSVAKWVASLVALRLADDGALSLSEPITTYLPDYREDVGGRVTLHHLLSNTSGVPNDLVAAYHADPAVLNEPLTTSEAVGRFASGDLAFEPGDRFDYSHSNWILVQAVVERASGRTFDGAVADYVTSPLGLHHTGVFWDGSPDPGLAPGYEALEPEPVRVDTPAPRYLAATGGVYSTAPDLFAILDALYDGPLLSDRTRRQLDAVTSEDPDLSVGAQAGGYAYGGRVRAMELGDHVERVLWHTGSNGPSKVRVSRVLSDGLTIITLTNAGVDHEATGALVERVLGSLYR